MEERTGIVAGDGLFTGQRGGSLEAPEIYCLVQRYAHAARLGGDATHPAPYRENWVVYF